MPPTTIGLLGGGQLGRMMTMEARRMGYRVACWTGGPDEGPAGLADERIELPFDSGDGLDRFLALSDVATVEFENIPLSLLETIEERLPLRPSAKAIGIAQHREREKIFLRDHGFPCVPFATIQSAAELTEQISLLPESGGILKTAEFGYDGKGQIPIEGDSDAVSIWLELDAPRAILEHRIELDREFSILVVRAPDGTTVLYDPAENIHRRHILHLSLFPAALPPECLRQGAEIAESIAHSLDYVGVLAVEFFLSTTGRVLVNELAPRPHNSGHHTLDSCSVSQFEQQVRSVCGISPGTPRRHSAAVMRNLLGDVWPAGGAEPDWNAIHRVPGASLHLYGKRAARTGRKMGHVTVAAPTLAEASQGIEAIGRSLDN